MVDQLDYRHWLFAASCGGLKHSDEVFKCPEPKRAMVVHADGEAEA